MPFPLANRREAITMPQTHNLPANALDKRNPLRAFTASCETNPISGVRRGLGILLTRRHEDMNKKVEGKAV